MSVGPQRSLGARLLKFWLGTDQISFFAALVGAAVALGNLYAFYVVYFSDRPIPPHWETVVMGLFFALFMMFGLFFSVGRLARMMSPWAALATLTAAGICPLAMMILGGKISPLLMIVGVIAFVLAAFLTAKAIEKRFC
jgi:hypothetical protein